MKLPLVGILAVYVLAFQVTEFNLVVRPFDQTVEMLFSKAISSRLLKNYS